MSRFIRNLARSGIQVQRRYSARGGRALSTGGPQIGLPSAGAFVPRARIRGDWNVSASLDVRFPLQEFITAVEKKERAVLFGSGRYAMRTFRSQLRRKPPARLTRGGKGRRRRVTKRYRQEIEEKKTRPPYFRTGILYRSVDFAVNLERGDFVSGPPLVTGLNRRTKSRLPVPALLDEGGLAMMKVARRRGLPATWRQVRYRSFPYRQFVFQKTRLFFLRKMGEVELR